MKIYNMQLITGTAEATQGLLKNINYILDEMSLDKSDEWYVVFLPYLLWDENKESIINETLKRDDIIIQMNTGFDIGNDLFTFALRTCKKAFCT